MTPQQFDRFVAKIDASAGPCWVWTAAKIPRGYGKFGVGNHRAAFAHRLAYTHFIGDIPAMKELDHLCRNPSCVNPTHLEAVSHCVNVRRGSAGAITAARNVASRGQAKAPRSPLHRERLIAILHRNHAKAASKTHCKRSGHLFDADNTVRYNGRRSCRICRNEAQMRYQRRCKAMAA